MEYILIETLRVFFFIFLILFIYASVKRISQLWLERERKIDVKNLSLLILFTPVIGGIVMLLGLILTSPIHRAIALHLSTSNRLLVFIPLYQAFSISFLLHLL